MHLIVTAKTYIIANIYFVHTDQETMIVLIFLNLMTRLQWN